MAGSRYFFLTLFAVAGLLFGSFIIVDNTSSTALAQQSGPLNRPADPVVMRGENVPTLIGAAPGELVAWRHTATGWEQVPVQVDERAVVDFGKIYNQALIGVTDTFYTDPNTYTGTDPDATFDAGDEIVFMAKDTGEYAPGTATEPPGVRPGSGVEVRITDPLDSSRVGYLYLFRQTGGLDPGAGRPYVTYNFSLNNGTYLTSYNLQSGPNPENSSASSAYYRHHFSDRWVDDELNVTASNGSGTATGVDILDRHKTMYQPGDCRRTEDTFSNGKGAFVTNKSGPVRAIRSYMGANSGDYTQREHLFYERRQDMATFLRVHELGGIGDIFDYSPAAAGMSYYNDLNQNGALVDGAPETLASGPIRWELLTGPQGSLAITHNYVSNIAGLSHSSYYLDDDTPADTQCTGDAFSYASSGPQLSTIPCTDIAHGCANKLTHWRHIYYDGPGLTTVDAAARSNAALIPLTFVIAEWPKTAPVAPTGLAASATSSSQINLTWADNSANEYGFKVERCTGADCVEFIETAQRGANANYYNDVTVTAGTTYRYRVRAFNATGDSGYSNTAEAVTPVPQSPPAAPTSLSAAAISISQIDLTWADNSGNEDGFKIERCQGSGCTNFTQVAQVVANMSAYQDTGRTAGTTYSYRVRAFNGSGDSGYSNTATATTYAPPQPPAAPSNLSATAVSSSQIDLSWRDNSGNESGFRIERCAGSPTCTNFAEIATVSSNVTKYSNAGLARRTTYRYRVRAYNTGGNSAYSNLKAATTK